MTRLRNIFVILFTITLHLYNYSFFNKKIINKKSNTTSNTSIYTIASISTTCFTLLAIYLIKKHVRHSDVTLGNQVIVNQELVPSHQPEHDNDIDNRFVWEIQLHQELLTMDPQIQYAIALKVRACVRKKLLKEYPEFIIDKIDLDEMIEKLPEEIQDDLTIYARQQTALLAMLYFFNQAKVTQ